MMAVSDQDLLWYHQNGIDPATGMSTNQAVRNDYFASQAMNNGAAFATGNRSGSDALARQQAIRGQAGATLGQTNRYMKDYAARNPNAVADALSNARDGANFGVGFGGGKPIFKNASQAQQWLRTQGGNAGAVGLGGARVSNFAQSPMGQASASPANSWDSLGANSDPTQIVNSYRDFIGSRGGDTPANRAEAEAFLRSKGISQDVINNSYQQFLGNQPGGMPAAGDFAGPQGGAPGGMGPTAGGAQGGMGSMGGGLVQGVNVNQYNQNPYLAQMGNVLTNRVTDNLQRNIMPGIRSNSIAAGGFGGSRQGVVEANAFKDANQTISDALTGAYFGDFTQQMNRNLAQYGQNQNFFGQQRGQDLQSTALGADLFQRGNQGLLGQGQGVFGLGSQQQQAPWQVVNNGNAGLGQWSGYGTTTSANTGGGAQGAFGGALAGGQLGNLWGGGSSQLGRMSNSDIEKSWYLG